VEMEETELIFIEKTQLLQQLKETETKLTKLLEAQS